MTISEKIFEKLEELSMSQKEFSDRTGILQSTISEWKKKKTNPQSDKIMTICEALGVTPEWLLSEKNDNVNSENDYYLIQKDSDIGKLVTCYQKSDPKFRERIMGYVEALNIIQKPGIETV